MKLLFVDEEVDLCLSDSLKHLHNLHDSSIRVSHILLKHIYCHNTLVYKALPLNHLNTLSVLPVCSVVVDNHISDGQQSPRCS